MTVIDEQTIELSQDVDSNSLFDKMTTLLSKVQLSNKIWVVPLIIGVSIIILVFINIFNSSLCCCKNKKKPKVSFKENGKWWSCFFSFKKKKKNSLKIDG